MALKLFRRKAKAAKEEIVEEVKAAVLPILEDKIPDELGEVKKVAAAIASKQDTIEEENEVVTVEESVADEPVQDEAENSDPTANTSKNDESEGATKEVETNSETKEQTGTFACCQGSSADVLKNLQAAVGMA